MSDLDDRGELRPCYRTLNEPTRLLGLSLATWTAVLVAGGIAYAFVSASPLPWRFNFSIVVIGLGAPVMLLALRDPGTIGPGRLLVAVLAWRIRGSRLTSTTTVDRGGVRLDVALEEHGPEPVNDLGWIKEARQ